MNDKPMMKCGHAASGINNRTGRPVCVSCAGLGVGAEEVDDAPPSLDGRMARCAYYGSAPRNNECGVCRGKAACECERPSSTSLAFFGGNPGGDFDQFYCGCHSWN